MPGPPFIHPAPRTRTVLSHFARIANIPDVDPRRMQRHRRASSASSSSGGDRDRDSHSPGRSRAGSRRTSLSGSPGSGSGSGRGPGNQRRVGSVGSFDAGFAVAAPRVAERV